MIVQTLAIWKPFCRILGSFKNILEPWRLLNRLFDPQLVGLEAASVSIILRPAKLDALWRLPMAIEGWKEKMRRYAQEDRRGPHQ